MPSGHGPPDDMRAAMPAAGSLSFDVVSQARPQEGAAALDDAALAAVLRERVSAPSGLPLPAGPTRIEEGGATPRCLHVHCHALLSV